MEKVILNWIFNNSNNLSFDEFNDFILTYSEEPAQSILDLKKNKNKIKGDLFESFCKIYLKNIKNFDEVWYLKQIPNELKTFLGLSKMDFGIDLVAVKQNKYYAIQCKFRKKKKNIKKGIPWKQLSTFYGLVYKTGPYEKHIVMTNCDYVRHIGKKTKKDQSICYGSFCKLNNFDWLNIIKPLQNNNENKNILMDKILNDKKISIKKDKLDNILSIEELRNKRIKYYLEKNLDSIDNNNKIIFI